MNIAIKVNNARSSAVIDIDGVIGVPEGVEHEEQGRVSSFEGLRSKLKEVGQPLQSILVNIRSMGGDVNDALLIYDALRSTGAQITTRCYGYTASAATIIAQAGSEGLREIDSKALYLIHKSNLYAEGNAEELEAQVDLLRKTDEQIATIYAERSGHSVEEFVRLMAENNGNGKWLTASEAVVAGLADKISTSNKFFMENKTKKGVFNSIVSALAEALGVDRPTPTDYVLVAKDGTAIEVHKEEGEAPEIGDRVSAPDGTYELEDGTKLIIEGGKIVDKVEYRPEPTNDELEELRKENEALKAELEALKKKQLSSEETEVLNFVKAMGGVAHLRKLTSNHTPVKREPVKAKASTITDEDFIAQLRETRKNK